MKKIILLIILITLPLICFAQDATVLTPALTQEGIKPVTEIFFPAFAKFYKEKSRLPSYEDIKELKSIIKETSIGQGKPIDLDKYEFISFTLQPNGELKVECAIKAEQGGRFIYEFVFRYKVEEKSK